MQNPIVDIGKHYLYRYIRHDKNEPFYIGIGTKNKDDLKYGTYTRAGNKKTNKDWQDIVDNTIHTVEILLESDNYKFIKEKEKEFIKLYGRINRTTGPLTNLNNGGQGNNGYIPTKETLARLSESHKGKRISPESQAKRIESLKRRYQLYPARKRTAEEREVLSKLQLGVKQTAETKAKRADTIKRAKDELMRGNTEVKVGNAKGVINTETGIIYSSIEMAAGSINMKPSTLYMQLRGVNRNRTSFVYLSTYKNKE